MKKYLLIGMTMAITLLAFAANPVFGQVGTIRIEPHGSYYPSPIMLSSPATFNISVQPSADPTTDPHILLVMTNSCYHGLTDPVAVTWSGDYISFGLGDFTEVDTGDEVPSTATVPYQVSSLKDHLNTSESVWWTMGPFLAGDITQTKQEFTVHLPSTDPRMLVYAIGKTGEETELFNNRVPPTKAGFVIPELGPVLLAVASFSAFALYAIKRRKALSLK